MELKENDIVMCTVKNIEGTTVFLHIEGNGEGSMVMSEVAAGRIRNLREYVYPNKKIVCKVLKILNNHPQLSLRRVTGKEREEMQDKWKKEKTFFSMLKTIVKEHEKTLDKIKEKYSPADFFDEVKENPSLLEKFMKKEEAQNFAKLLSEKREKEKEVKKTIVLKSSSDSGVNDIKEILNIKDIKISYLGSSQFLLSAQGNDFKQANIKINSAIEEIQNRAKNKKAILEIREK